MIDIEQKKKVEQNFFQEKLIQTQYDMKKWHKKNNRMLEEYKKCKQGH